MWILGSTHPGLGITSDLDPQFSKKCCFCLLGSVLSWILKKTAIVQKEISFTDCIFKRLPSSSTQLVSATGSQVPSRTWALSEAWWHPFQFCFMIIHFVNSFIPFISKLLININRPCQKRAMRGLSEELPMHINQFLIYNLYIQLLLSFQGRQGKENLESSQTWYQSNRQFHSNNEPDPQHHQ